MNNRVDDTTALRNLSKYSLVDVALISQKNWPFNNIDVRTSNVPYAKQALQIIQYVWADPPEFQKYRQKVKFTLQQATKAQRGSRGIALLFL